MRHKLDKEARAEQSRINGAKSKGPITAEGKAISSVNSIKHGFAATINVLLNIEDAPLFHIHVAGFRSTFNPVTYVENSLVEQLAAINWRQARLVSIETALLDAQISIAADNVDFLNPHSADDHYLHLIKAWQALSHQPPKPTEPYDQTMPPLGYDITSLELVRRYQVSLDRQFRNVLLNLRQIRQDVVAAPTPQPAAAQIEPSPAPSQAQSKIKLVLWDPPSTPKIEHETSPTTEPTPISPIHKR